PAVKQATQHSIFRPVATNCGSIVTAVVERLADRIHAQGTHAATLLLLRAGDRFVAIDVTLLPHSSGAVVEHQLPAVLAARRDDDKCAGISLADRRGGLYVGSAPQRGPAARVPVVGIDQEHGAESEPDEQHI